RRRQALARAMGGPEKLKRHRDNGKLNVRERIDALLDEGSFHEMGELSGFAAYDGAGQLAEFTPANFICGRGRIDGRPVVVEGDDFTGRGGAADAGLREKMIAAEMMASAMRMPLIRLIDGTAAAARSRRWRWWAAPMCRRCAAGSTRSPTWRTCRSWRSRSA